MCSESTTLPEEWRPVAEFDGVYEVSSLGRVRRATQARSTWAGRILRQKTDRKGYSCVVLCHHPVRVHRKVHRLVAIAFIPNPGQRDQINHRDGIKANNTVSNLEWATNAENTRHKVEHGLARPGGKSKITGSQAEEIKRLRGTLTTTEIGRLFGISQSHVSQIHRGRYW